jgi:hypothetical protein
VLRHIDGSHPGKFAENGNLVQRVVNVVAAL